MKSVDKKELVDPLHLIVGIVLIAGGLLYMFDYRSWGLIVASIGLLMEAVKQVVK